MVALRILFLAILPVTVARFSKFEPIETYLFATTADDRLSSKLVRVVISSKTDRVKWLRHIPKIITDFVYVEARKVF